MISIHPSGPILSTELKLSWVGHPGPGMAIYSNIQLSVYIKRSQDVFEPDPILKND